MDNEITVVDDKPKDIQVSTDAPVMVQIVQMMASGITVDVDQIKAIQEICQQQDADDARKAFASAFTITQSDIESVVKSKHNPQTGSKYAGLDDIIEMSKPVYTKHGFSVIFYEGTTEVPENIRVCADVLHKAGHKETYHYDVPLGGMGIKGTVNMTKIHGKATSVSYGKRYLLCMIWNIPTQDDDGNAGGKKPIEIPTPNKKETEVIQLICDALPPKEGFIASPQKIGSLCYAAQKEYPRNEKTVPAIVEWILQKHQDSQIYVQ